MTIYLTSSKMYEKDKLVLPNIIKEEFDCIELNEDTIFDWAIEDDKIILKPRNIVTTDDIIGIIDDDGGEWDIDNEIYSLWILDIRGENMGFLASSKIYGDYQIDIPKEVIEEFNVERDSIMEWIINEDGRISINFRKKYSIKDLVGAFHLDEEVSSVDLKRSLYE